MTCGGFTCSKNALAALNVLYILVAFILIGVAAYGKTAPYFTSLKLMGGIIACGVFLLLIAIVGLIGAVKHHQVLLFFYMIILFLLFLVQFAVACALLALNEAQQEQVAKWGWHEATTPLKNSTQHYLDCCGFSEEHHWHNDTTPHPMDHPPCGIGKDGMGSNLKCCREEHASAPCCSGELSNSTEDTCPEQCADCWSKVSHQMNQAIKTVGGIGLFFSFTEIIGVWLAVRYRNQKDPRANPSAFL